MNVIHALRIGEFGASPRRNSTRSLDAVLSHVHMSQSASLSQVQGLVPNLRRDSFSSRRSPCLLASEPFIPLVLRLGLKEQCQLIVSDIKYNGRCNFDQVLQAFLSKSCPEGRPGNLLQDVLTAVLPICSGLSELVTDYCKASNTERGRYVSLLSLINGALSGLALLNEVADILKPHVFRKERLDLVAHYTASSTTVEPSEMDSSHGEDVQTSAQEHLPSLLFTSLPAALRITGSPRESLTWPDVLAAFELRQNNTTEPLTPPPDTYTVARRDIAIPHIQNVKDMMPSTSECDCFRQGERTSSCQTCYPSPPGYDNFPDTTRRMPPAIQAALYGVNRMGCTLGATHAITLLVIDDVVWVWWYDRQGAIQTDGLNFVQDLPRFLVLLFALQRFDLEDWGFHPALDPLPLQRHGVRKQGSARETTITLNTGAEITVDLASRTQRDDRLEGRFTEVLAASVVNARNSDDRSYVVKIGWADMARVPEHVVVEKTEDEARRHPDVKDHVPYMLGWKDDDGFATSRIRDVLSIPPVSTSTPTSRPAPSRILRIIVFERLYRVQTLDGRGMMTVLLQCVKCHYALWRAGIHHNDLSQNNIMYRIIDGKVYGVVNDWDLATLDETGHEGFDPAGTIPYVSMDLLEGWIAKRPKPPRRLYRHDNESFVWIMVHLFLSHDEGVYVAWQGEDDWKVSD
ncbi:hypothetical protein OF83DRAFT_1131027, partial [Amylostereum chailletii]